MTRKSSRRGKAAVPESPPVARRRRSRSQLLAAELYQTGHVLAIEYLSSWLIHEISQPLMATVATAQAMRRLLGRGCLNPQEIGQSIEEVMAYQRRAGRILQSLRAVLPKSEPKRTRLDLSGIIVEVVGFLTERGDLQGTRVRLSLGRNPPSVSGAPILLRHVFLNLILSAVAAMRNTPARERRLWITARPGREPATIHFVIRNTREQLRKPDSIQFPGALARAHSDATALGLAVAEAIVAEHGGRTWIRRNQRGAELHVTLPVAPGTSA